MNEWLKDHFKTEELPSAEVLVRAYRVATLALREANKANFPNVDFNRLRRLIEEMEANAEICNILAENGI